MEKKIALVTGAARGLGLEFCRQLGKKGYQIILTSRKVEPGQTAVKELKDAGYEAWHQVLDVRSEDHMAKLSRNLQDNFGKLDLLVNNAGISIFHEMDKVDFDHWTHAWEETFKTNLFAAANMSYWAGKAMMKTGGGRIVNVSSRGSFRGEPTKPAYGASKAALNAMSQSLAKKLAPHNIYIGVVAPGFTETEMAAVTLTPAERENLLRESPFQRMAQPEEVAHAVLFLASEGAEYTSGTIIDVNGASYLRS